MEIAFRWKKNRVGSRGAKNQLAMFIESATTTTKKTSSNQHGMKTRGQLSWKIRQKSSDIFFHLRKMFCQMHYIFLRDYLGCTVSLGPIQNGHFIVRNEIDRKGTNKHAKRTALK